MHTVIHFHYWEISLKIPRQNGRVENLLTKLKIFLFPHHGDICQLTTLVHVTLASLILTVEESETLKRTLQRKQEQKIKTEKQPINSVTFFVLCTVLQK